MDKLAKIDVRNGLPYQSDEGIFYHVEDVEREIARLKSEIREALNVLQNCPPIEISKHIGILAIRLEELSK